MGEGLRDVWTCGVLLQLDLGPRKHLDVGQVLFQLAQFHCCRKEKEIISKVSRLFSKILKFPRKWGTSTPPITVILLQQQQQRGQDRPMQEWPAFLWAGCMDLLWCGFDMGIYAPSVMLCVSVKFKRREKIDLMS